MTTRQPILDDEMLAMAERRRLLAEEERSLLGRDDDESQKRGWAIAAEIDSMNDRLDQTGDAALLSFADAYEGVDPETLPAEERDAVVGVRTLLLI